MPQDEIRDRDRVIQIKERAGHIWFAVAGNRKYSWIGLALGLSLHTLIDGMALAASVIIDAEHHTEGGWALFGLGTFCAIFLHKPLDAMSIATQRPSKHHIRLVAHLS